ncbi:TonB-dependent siderophore receptor [Pseudothauera nasutitermitis]|uniref:TonB-dependent siderophore receptor n=1 Tax=Pseudothauera nasutitermitis TaxID=2565930 RepID=A0A4S4AXF3_9RHOO|nr:TonB-dependent siderophore receptor [Pseudothauera nasutitermitis]THF64773.1 TonB-dependent siderophore receptor [Pseudothauera nasutitermitis]
MRQPHGPACPTRLTRPAHAVRHALLALTLLTAGGTVFSAPATADTQSTADQGRIAYDLAAGPLEQVLTEFAARAGISLTIPPALVAGKASNGLQGRYAIEDGLARILAGSGLEASGSGRTYVVVARPGGEVRLAPVTVTAQGSRGGATEGTGRYTSPAPLTTATPLGLTVKETPQSVSVITRQRMEDQGLTTIQQTLEQVPGIKTGSLGTELGNASARGYAIANYQYDGVNTFVEVLGGGAVPSATTADMAIYDRVEVLRGASGLVTGAGDPSGTINMVRKKPTAEFQGAVEAGIGSWDDKRVVLDLSGPLNEARSLRGRLIAVAQGAGSYIDHYGRKKGLVYGVVEADLTSTTRLTAGLEHERTKVKGQGSFVGFPLWFSDGTRTDLPRSFTASSRNNWLNLESTKVFATLDQQLANDWTLKLSANHGRLSHRDGRVYLASNNGFADLAGDGLRLNATQRIGHIEQSTVDLNLRGPFTLFSRQHELVLGATYEDYEQPINRYDDTSGLHGTAFNLFSWDRTGAGVYGSAAAVISGYTMEQTSLYGAARFQVSDRLKLIAGTRVFWQDYDFAEDWAGGHYGTTSSEDSVFTPYGGFVYDIDKVHSAYASYSTIYKAQTVRDRNGAVLDPREGANYEIGLKSDWLDGRLNTAVALYQIRQDNLAESDPGYTVPGTTNTAAYRAVKGAKTTGVDVEVYGALSRGWNVSASWTYGQTKNADGDRINTTFPRHMVKLWTTYRLPGEWNRLTIGGGANWQSKTYSTVSAWQIGRDLHWEQKAYAVANLMARYDFDDKLSATLNVNNLFDKKYIASVSDWWYSGMYGTPRSVALNLRYNF